MKKQFTLLMGLLILLLSSLAGTTFAEAPTPPAAPVEEKKAWTVDEVVGLVDASALKWGVSENTFRLVVWNESQFQATAINSTDSHALSKGSHGVGQFSRETFKGNAQEMFALGIAKEKYTDVYNAEVALDVMGYMLSHKKARAWTGYRVCILHEKIIYKGKQIPCIPLPAAYVVKK